MLVFTIHNLKKTVCRTNPRFFQLRRHTSFPQRAHKGPIFQLKNLQHNKYYPTHTKSNSVDKIWNRNDGLGRISNESFQHFWKGPNRKYGLSLNYAMGLYKVF